MIRVMVILIAMTGPALAEDCSLPSANINCAMVNKLRALTQQGFTPQETMVWVDYGIRWHDQCMRSRSTFECDRAANEAVRRAIKANREAAHEEH